MEQNDHVTGNQISADITIYTNDDGHIAIHSTLASATIVLDDNEILPLISALAKQASAIWRDEYQDKRYIHHQPGTTNQ